MTMKVVLALVLMAVVQPIDCLAAGKTGTVTIDEIGAKDFVNYTTGGKPLDYCEPPRSVVFKMASS